MATPRVVIVHRATEYEELLDRHGTRGQVEFFLRTRGQTLGALDERHERAHDALREVGAAIDLDWRRASVERGELPRFGFEPDDIVVAVGQDGLVANLAKYVGCPADHRNQPASRGQRRCPRAAFSRARGGVAGAGGRRPGADDRSHDGVRDVGRRPDPRGPQRGVSSDSRGISPRATKSLSKAGCGSGSRRRGSSSARARARRVGAVRCTGSRRRACRCRSPPTRR
jgi:hypothetical protein